MNAGQIWWTPGKTGPTLTLNLGGGKIKKTVEMDTETQVLTLVLRKFLLEDSQVTLTWKSDGVLWMQLTKKIPGAETTDRVALPPGRLVTLEISTEAGTPEATVTIRRN